MRKGIPCDNCGTRKAPREILHWSALVEDRPDGHIHLCQSCFRRLGLRLRPLHLKAKGSGR